MKMKVFLIVVSLFALLLFSACQNNQDIETEFESKSRYAHIMEFRNSLGHVRLSLAWLENRGYTQVIFVHSEEEFLKGEFPEGAVVAWPGLVAYVRREGMNRWIREYEIDVTPFSLEYPLTKDDMVDNWINVRRLWRHFDRYASWDSRRWVDYEFGRIRGAELEILNEALETAGIDVVEHGLRDYSDTGSRNTETLRRIINELYDKLDEDVQQQLQARIPHFMARYRSEQRMREIGDARRLAEQEAYESDE